MVPTGNLSTVEAHAILARNQTRATEPDHDMTASSTGEHANEPPDQGGALRRVVIADDHPIVRDALRKLLAKIEKLEVSEADSFSSLKSILEHAPADLVLLDLKMPGAEGFSCLNHLRQQYPGLAIAIVSGNTQPGIIHGALELGARAFIPKTLEVRKLTAALQAVLAGEAWAPASKANTRSASTGDGRAKLDRLTPQQLRVLGLLARGRLNKQIAFELGMKEATVKGHITTILLRLGLRRRTEAALFAQRMLQIS